MTYSDKAAAFLAHNPTVIGTRAGVTYFEHPTLGEDAPLYFIEDGKLRRSEFWDMDSIQDSQWNAIGH